MVKVCEITPFFIIRANFLKKAVILCKKIFVHLGNNRRGCFRFKGFGICLKATRFLCIRGSYLSVSVQFVYLKRPIYLLEQERIKELYRC